MSLAIVVPYRDRAEHLRVLVPALEAYLRDRCPGLSTRPYVVEQEPGKPFNRGMLLNIGFARARADGHHQVCFHDVDYVPVEADYSAVAGPTRLIWHGADRQHRYDIFFGAVTAFPAADFERVNGFSNAFWGWGFEDAELRLRCLAAGLVISFRDGTFRPLAHAHGGLTAAGGWTTTAVRNRALLEGRFRRMKRGETGAGDGLDSLRYRLSLVPVPVVEPRSPDFALTHMLVAI